MTGRRRASRARAYLAFAFFWGRLFWALSVLGFAVGLVLVANPV